MAALLAFANASHAVEISFDNTVRPFLTEHCVSCHGEKKQKGKLRLDTLDPANLGGADVETWGNIVEALEFAEMPPEDEPQPKRHAIDRVTAWAKAKLAAAGHESDVDHKLLQPEYANLVNHEKLFDGSHRGPASSPPRLWRIHPEVYDIFIKDFGGGLNVGGAISRPFLVGEGKGVPTNYAALLAADGATLSQIMMNCRQIADYQTVGFKKTEIDRKTKQPIERVYRKAPKSFDAILEAEGGATEAQIQAAVTEEFRIALSRDPDEAELKRFAGLLTDSIAIGGKARGLRTMAMAVLLQPEAIYRMEVGLGEADEHGRRMLSPYELAHAIAYALTDTPPDKLMLGPSHRHGIHPPSLLDLAEQGKLSTRVEVRAVVQRIWNDDRIKKPRILRFFREYFGYHHAETVFKGGRAGREFATAHFVNSADQLVMHFVDRDRDVLRELLTTDRYFVAGSGSAEAYERSIKYITERINKDKPNDVNYKYFITRTKETGKKPMPQANPTWRQTVRFYNLDPDEWDYPIEQPFAMPRNQRVGLLTHPAWLVAWSGNFGNDPIRRGKWIREHLLAGSIPEVPITVDASVPEDPHKTLRQRLTKTRKDYCWKCHKKMEPLGLPFEAYTDFGRYRDREGLGPTKALRDAKETAPVDRSGQIIESGDASIDGKVRDARDLMTKLADSDRARQSFVRHAFRYWMGRNETLTDSPTLIDADRAYVAGGGSFRSMVVEILTSDSFLYRK